MRNSIFRMAGILAAAATLFCGGCGDNGASSGVTRGGNVDKLLDTLRGTNDPKAPTLYTLEVTADPTAGGTVSKSPDKTQYEKDFNVQVTAKSATGYRFAGWSGASSDTANPITVKMDDKKEIIANFVPENVVTYTLAVNASPPNGGSVSKSPDKPEYEKDVNVQVTAKPATGYRFTGWSGASSDTANPITVKMDDKKEIIANFVPENVVTYTLAVNASPPNGGSVSKSPDKPEYEKDENVLITATPVTGYKFTAWSGSSTGTANPLTVKMDGKKELTANFAWQGTTPPPPTDTTYTITFNSQEGSAVTAQNISHGGKVTEPAAPTRAGYTFGGWYKESAYTTQWNFSTDVVTSAVTLYAKWNADGTTPPNPTSHAVTFNSQEGSAVTSQTVENGGKVTEPAAPTRAGYTFGGWYKESAYTTQWNFSTDVVTSAVTLYAKWNADGTTPPNPTSHAVTFNSQEGSAVTSQTVENGGKVTEPAAPTRAGYTFGGWYKESAYTTPWKFDTDVVTSAITLYAKWTLNTYTITFNLNYTDAPTLAADTTGEGWKLDTLPTPTRDGYTFNGWYTAATGGTVVTKDTAFTKDTTIYARWTLNTYAVTFNSQGGSAVNAQNISHGGKATEPTDDPTLTGYTFGGWYKESACTTPWNFGTDVVTSAVTLYAKWTLNTYAVTFNSQEGSAVTAQNISHGGKATEPDDPTRAGYTFGGWFKEAACTNTWNFGTDAVTSAVTLYAKWTVSTYTITFDANGGTVDPTTATTGAGWKLASLPTPTWEGYLFVGWFTAASGGTRVDEGKVYDADAIIYAQWRFAFVDSRDNKIYNKTKIGNQVWMAENLNYDVPNNTTSDDVCYGNSADSCAKYGRLYNWTTAMNGASSSSASPSGVRGVCPSGWHLPSDAEWTTLTDFVGGESTAGRKLKSPQYWQSYSAVPGAAGTDDYGFSALPGGSGYMGGNFNGAGLAGVWWSTTPNSTIAGAALYVRSMDFGSGDVSRRGEGSRAYQYSVRCVQD